MSELLLHFSKSEVDDLLVLERGDGPYVFDSGGRRYIDALSSLFCGVTLGALSFTGVERFKAPFGRAPIDVTHVSNTNAFRDDGDPATFTQRLLDEVERAILAAGPDEVALIIAEPVQNSGGCLTPPNGYWRGLRELADRYGILLMADEVITGAGRLGEWFGIAREGVVPDLISLAIALTNIEIFERDGVLENARALEPHLEAKLRTLRELPIVGDTRGAGFFWAVELVSGEAGGRSTPASATSCCAPSCRAGCGRPG